MSKGQRQSSWSKSEYFLTVILFLGPLTWNKIFLGLKWWSKYIQL